MPSTGVCQLVTHESKSQSVNRTIQYRELSVVTIRILKLPLCYEGEAHLFFIRTPAAAVCCGDYKIFYAVSRIAHRLACTPIIHFQSALPTAPGSRKNVSWQNYLTVTQHIHSEICEYVYVFFKYREAGQTK